MKDRRTEDTVKEGERERGVEVRQKDGRAEDTVKEGGNEVWRGVWLGIEPVLHTTTRYGHTRTRYGHTRTRYGHTTTRYGHTTTRYDCSVLSSGLQGVSLCGDDLYDVTVTDGDCLLRVTLDPALNRLVERNVLCPGAMLGHASFSPALSVREGESAGRGGSESRFRLVSVEVCDDVIDERELDLTTLPWFNSTEPAGPMLPLRANRSTFLPLWNNVDYSGETWRESAPPPGGEEEEEEEQCDGVCLFSPAERPSVTVCELREAFLSGHRDITMGVVRRHLIVRIINKSHLMYYGKSDRNCACPYKAVLEVCDGSSSVCVVLWTSVCLDWYRCLRPGHILKLAHYRVKPSYHNKDTDIEISLNSRNPAAQISLLPESSVSPEHRPPPPTYSFYSGRELLDCLHGNLCDVIGLVTFSGRPERIRSKDGQGAELLEYRWLRLEDGTSDQPIMVKLFSTSQPETHNKLYPLCVVVFTRLKVIRTTDERFYLTNTTHTQVYCTGQGHHSEMPYRKLRPVRLFLQWLQSQDDGQVLSRALVGGFFIYPPPPVSLETYMKDRKGEPGFLKGAELQREVGRLCFRERRTFCIQATVTMVTHSHRGEEDYSLIWTSRGFSLSPSSSLPLHSSPHSSSPSSRLSSSPCLSRAPLSPSPRPSPSSPRPSPSSPRPSPSSPRPSPSSPRPSPSSPRPSSPRPSPSSPRPSPSSLCPSPSSRPSPSSPTSPVTQLTYSPLEGRLRKSPKRKQRQAETHRKRFKPLITSQPDQNRDTDILWDASMEFITKPNDHQDEDDEDEDASSFITAPLFPHITPVAMETLPLRYSHAHREEQAVTMAMQSGEWQTGGGTLEQFESPVESHYTLRLRALSDNVLVDAIFLPLSPPLAPPPLLPHSNTWLSILSHGAFSSHSPPPSPADLIGMATQLANQRLVCILEACHLGGARTEIILSRAYPLRH
ncbi:uncharacterized protein ACJ7VT_012355 [Polymixia lowei]